MIERCQSPECYATFDLWVTMEAFGRSATWCPACGALRDAYHVPDFVVEEVEDEEEAEDELL